MLTSQRRREILRRLVSLGYVEGRELASDLHVDPSTIRRDLDALARAGHLQRTHGGAKAVDDRTVDVPYAAKQSERVRQKEAVGLAAAAMVGEGDSVILDSGSTTYQVGLALRDRAHVTVVTNDLRIGKMLAAGRGLRLLVTGGELVSSVYSLVGDRAVSFVEDLSVDWTFLGADAIDRRSGITNTNTQEVPLKQAMLDVARRRVVVADSTKFGQHALARVTDLSGVDEIITDEELTEDELDKYEGKVRRVHAPAPQGSKAQQQVRHMRVDRALPRH